MIIPAFVILTSFPWTAQTNILSINVLILELRNIFHVRSKLQYVLGLEISYANKLPPIGLPNAAETPAAAPAAAAYLLKSSF